MAGVLVLCTLLLSSGVMCQDDDAADASVAPAADASAATGAADPGDASGSTAAPDVAATPAGDSGASAATADSSLVATIINLLNSDSQDGGIPVVTATPAVGDNRVTVVPDIPRVVKAVVPDVKCVDKENRPESNAVEAGVTTSDCEETKRIIQENPAAWCNKENCELKIFQEGNKVFVGSSDANSDTLANALQSQSLKDKLGLTNIKSSSSSKYSVFVGILVTGLLAALGLTVGYFKCQRRPDTKGVKLAEEAYPVDQENQGNTLVSVAPLNPPPETPEKPSVNGESPEAAKTQPPPPTNGHSTAKTADTEL